MGLTEANQRFDEMQSEVRFIRDVSLGEEVYDVYQAKKKSGKPKDEEPSKFNTFPAGYYYPWLIRTVTNRLDELL